MLCAALRLFRCEARLSARKADKMSWRIHTAYTHTHYVYPHPPPSILILQPPLRPLTPSPPFAMRMYVRSRAPSHSPCLGVGGAALQQQHIVAKTSTASSLTFSSRVCSHTHTHTHQRGAQGSCRFRVEIPLFLEVCVCVCAAQIVRPTDSTFDTHSHCRP